MMQQKLVRYTKLHGDGKSELSKCLAGALVRVLTSTEKMLLPPPSSLVEGAAGAVGAELGEAAGGACNSQQVLT